MLQLTMVEALPLAKKASKKRKAFAAQPDVPGTVAQPETAANGSVLDVSGLRIKKKKRQHTDGVSLRENGAFAHKRQAQLNVVGDRDLAAKGPAIKKSLYKEVPQLAAQTSSELETWRQQRGISVDDCDGTNPVTSFDQAGKRPCGQKSTMADFWVS